MATKISPSTEERVARHMAAEDWLTDPADDAWWNSRTPKFRADYLASARTVIAIVHGHNLPAGPVTPQDPT